MPPNDIVDRAGLAPVPGDGAAESPVRSANDVPPDAVDAGSATRCQVLIGSDRSSSFHLRRFTMEPGGGMPPHTNRVEHQQYVLRGRARIGIGDRVIEVGPDDVVFIPGGVVHWYEAIGDEPFQFLCAVPNVPDEIEIVEKEGPDQG